MRTLLFLFIGLLMFAGWIVAKLLDKRRQRIASDTGPSSDETSLAHRLNEASATFTAAAESVGERHDSLKSALGDLATQCSNLSAQERSGFSFPRAARAGIMRLLLALYGVVERATIISKRSNSDGADALLAEATDLIATATGTLEGFAERADETTLTHLEADLDVLRERLSVVEPTSPGDDVGTR